MLYSDWNDPNIFGLHSSATSTELTRTMYNNRRQSYHLNFTFCSNSIQQKTTIHLVKIFGWTWIWICNSLIYPSSVPPRVFCLLTPLYCSAFSRFVDAHQPEMWRDPQYDVRRNAPDPGLFECWYFVPVGNCADPKALSSGRRKICRATARFLSARLLSRGSTRRFYAHEVTVACEYCTCWKWNNYYEYKSHASILY